MEDFKTRCDCIVEKLHNISFIFNSMLKLKQ